MTSKFLKVLMAASALIPVAATAQRGPDGQGGGDRGAWNGQRGGGDRGGWNGQRGGDRGDRGNREMRAPQQQQPQAQPQPQPQQVQAPQRDVSDQARGPRGNWQNGRQDGQPGRDARQDYRGNQGYQGQRDPRQNYQGQGYQGQGYQGQRDPRQTYQGQQFQGQRFQGRGDDRQQRGQYRGGYDNRQAYRGGYSNGYNRGGQWNRGWRNDNRYAWSNYRASNRGAYRLPRYYAPGGWSGGYRRFGVGFTLSNILFNQNYWIQDPYTYRLPEAYGPYQWVRYYNDALLVDIDSGQVVDTVYDIFW